MNGIGIRDRSACLLCRRSYPPHAADIPGSGPPPDPCLGLLEGVAQACCGHGVQRPFVVFGLDARPGDSGNGLGLTTVTGVAALTWFAERGVGPDIVDALSAALPSCRQCGCTDGLACPGGCSWVEPDLCSACASAGPESAAGARACEARLDLIPPERSEGGTLSTLATPHSRQRNLAHRDDSPALCELSASASLVDGAVEKSVDSELEREREGSVAVGRSRPCVERDDPA